MALLDRLIRDARKAMQAHDHIPLPAARWHESSESGRSGATIQCARCSKESFITCKPQPNEIQISGEAVALGCNVATKIRDVKTTVHANNDYSMEAVIGC